MSPTTKVPLVDASTDTGKWITAILSKPSEMYGKCVAGASCWINPEEFVSTISKVAGIKVSFKQVPDEIFKTIFPAPLGEMRLEALIFCREWHYYGPDADKQINESLQVGRGISSSNDARADQTIDS